MVCDLPAPLWLNQTRAGLQSSQENTTNSTYDLSFGQAETGSSGAPVYYNIYFGQDVFTLFDRPQAFTTALTASLPKDFTGSMPLFGVRAADLGITGTFTTDNLSGMSEGDAFAYPADSILGAIYHHDGYMLVNTVAGFPLRDGYLQLGTEIFRYDNAVDGYDGYHDAFKISSHNPFSTCNDGYGGHNYTVGAAVALFLGFEESNGVAFQPTELCNPAVPVWAESSLPGLQSAGDLGIGQVVELNWGPASAPAGQTIYFNVYWHTSITNLWDHPRGITDQQNVLVPGLSPGDGYYFAVRGTYFTDDINLNQLNQLSGQLFGYPDSTHLTADYAATGTPVMHTNSTAGFLSAGYLLLDNEFIQYSSKTATTFVVSKRDLFDFGNQAAHTAGTTVSMFRGIEETNAQVYHDVASWDKGEVGPHMPIPSGGPDYMQDADGYRSQPVDNLTEDRSDFEAANEDFPSYPFCGYRATNFVALYTRGVCNTYFGGQQDGFGGIDLNTVNLQRQELLLGITGEPFTLLRRKWTGRPCPKLSHRHEHPHARCGRCYGTTFEGGYDKFINPRDVRPAVDNPNGFIMARVSPYKNDLERSPERGLTQVDELTAWTLPVPQLKDSDILIRYKFDPATLDIIEEEFRYQVLNVTRNQIVVGNDGQQQFVLRKLDKTDIVYSFAVPIV